MVALLSSLELIEYYSVPNANIELRLDRPHGYCPSRRAAAYIKPHPIVPGLYFFFS